MEKRVWLKSTPLTWDFGDGSLGLSYAWCGKSPGRPSNRQTTLLPLDSPQTIMVS